jgi:hypothetical protein
MSDVITGMRQVIQDLVAPDLKAHSVKLDALQRQRDTLQKQIEILQDAAMKAIDAFRAEMRSEFALLRANNQIEIMRQITPLSERVAVREARAS